MLEALELFFKLVVGHVVADFWAQTSYVDYMKNRHNDPATFEGTEQPKQLMWPVALTAHAIMHGGAVWWITGNFALFFAETIAHWMIDFGRCDKRFGIYTDQALHLLCKVVWCAIALA